MAERKIEPPIEQITGIVLFYHENSPSIRKKIPDNLAPPGLAFQKIPVGSPIRKERPVIAHVLVTDLDQDGKQDVIVCDAGNNEVSWLRFADNTWTETLLAKMAVPVRSAVCDINKDGHLDLAVAGAGDVFPTDDPIGEAHLLTNRGDQTFDQVPLALGVSRISDVQPADFDSDGDIDFAVAQFGFRKTGGLGWWEQVVDGKFKFHSILSMNGVMHLSIADFENKGRPNIIALISQEHEIIAEFTRHPNGSFLNRTIARANHPMFGSSGIFPVDLDEDGDLDLLYTNGDMMDEDPDSKPYHGVCWLENHDGDFRLRHLAAMPGCYCARPHDMDGDGDLDIVVSNMNFDWKSWDFPSLTWLENDGMQNFTARRISYSPANLASCDVGDLNHDGIPDIIAGSMHLPGPVERIGRVTVWLGQPAAETSIVAPAP